MKTRGFTLLEVMVAVAILGLSLTVILSAQAGLYSGGAYAQHTSVATGLLRCRMTEIEERMLKLGYPEVETHAWFGLFLPAGSPGEVVSRIYQDTRKIIEEPDFRQKQLIDKGYDVVGSSPEEFAAYIRKDSESRARAVRISGAKAE